MSAEKDHAAESDPDMATAPCMSGKCMQQVKTAVDSGGKFTARSALGQRCLDYQPKPEIPNDQSCAQTACYSCDATSRST